MAELPTLIKALLNPQAYPHTPKKVDLIQTQMSFLLLTGDYVYKVKKPVNLGYLDYTTLGKRRFFCHQEVKLNRRLCPEIYLSVVPIVKGKGQICLEGKGKAIEYAIKMRQLPQERMMNVLLQASQVTPEMVTKVAEKLAIFHKKAKTNLEVSAFGEVSTVRKNTDENFTQTEKYIGISISPQKYHHIKHYTDNFLEKNASLFLERIKQKRIRDCHGDLHAAHICFTNGIFIYDCIEFNDRFRYCDVASEIAFLAMDLDHYARADLSYHFITAYIQLSQDKGLTQLLNFYKCYRAYVRGKVESFKLDDPYILTTEKERILAVAQGYFGLAYHYTRQRPLLFITTGLLGTGKTTLAQALSQRLGLVIISSDVTRKKLAGIPLTEHRFDEFKTGIYSEDFSRRTYDAMLAEAEKLLSQGQSVILDASFKKRTDRLQARKIADKIGADFLVIECILDEEIAKKRLEQRLKEGTISDGRWEIFEPQKQDFERVVEFPPESHIIVDTAQSLSKIIGLILKKVE